MTKRTYAELQTILADNVTGAITPQDIRDLLDSLAINRAGIIDDIPHTQGVSVAGEWEQLTIISSIPAVTSGPIHVRTDGVIELSSKGLYNVDIILQLSDLSDLSNNSELELQFWVSDGDELSYQPLSAIESFTRTSNTNSGIIRLQSEMYVQTIPRYVQARIRCTDTGDMVFGDIYVIGKSHPVETDPV